MKKNIHPKYEETTFTCLCGNTFKTGSTKSNVRIEICSHCHPFYTGEQRFVDTAGRVDKFKKKYASYNKSSETAESEKVVTSSENSTAKKTKK
jgi:large subunit ribosomal protein L31